MQPVLVMIQGPEPGSMYRLPDNRVTTIGRSSRNTIRVITPSISRFHCEIACVNGTWELSDLNSRKGTAVNGVRVRDKTVLRPGDVIRLTRTVFRFGMVEDSVYATQAITAVKEAELDVRLVHKGEATATLDDIQVRSRLEGLRVRQTRAEERQERRTNKAFLCVVATFVGVAVAGVLLVGYLRRANRARENAAVARAAFDAGVALAREGCEDEALAQLRRVREEYAGGPIADAAVKQCREILWIGVQKRLQQVAELEAEGDYSSSLALYAELAEMHPDQDVTELLERRRDYTVRLAHASFRTLDRTARQHVADGDLESALKLYRWAGQHMGVDELVQSAAREAGALEKRTLR